MKSYTLAYYWKSRSIWIRYYPTHHILSIDVTPSFVSDRSIIADISEPTWYLPDDFDLDRNPRFSFCPRKRKIITNKDYISELNWIAVTSILRLFTIDKLRQTTTKTHALQFVKFAIFSPVSLLSLLLGEFLIEILFILAILFIKRYDKNIFS